MVNIFSQKGHFLRLGIGVGYIFPEWAVEKEQQKKLIGVIFDPVLAVFKSRVF